MIIRMETVVPSSATAKSPSAEGPNGSFPTQGNTWGSSRYPALWAPWEISRSTASWPALPMDRAGCIAPSQQSDESHIKQFGGWLDHLPRSTWPCCVNGAPLVLPLWTPSLPNRSGLGLGLWLCHSEISRAIADCHSEVENQDWWVLCVSSENLRSPTMSFELATQGDYCKGNAMWENCLCVLSFVDFERRSFKYRRTNEAPSIGTFVLWTNTVVENGAGIIQLRLNNGQWDLQRLLWKKWTFFWFWFHFEEYRPFILRTDYHNPP